MKLILVVYTIAHLLIISTETNAEIKVESSKDNVVASRLEGSWQVDDSMMERFAGRKNLVPGQQVTFKSDPSVVQKLPKKIEKFVKDKKIYSAGTCNLSDEKDGQYHFLVLQHHGNLHLWLFPKVNNDEMEGCTPMLMLVPAKEKANDQLFLTDLDTVNQSSVFSTTPYSRVKVEDTK